jgi:hypothetical protein
MPPTFCLALSPLNIRTGHVLWVSASHTTWHNAARPQESQDPPNVRTEWTYAPYINENRGRIYLLLFVLH